MPPKLYDDPQHITIVLSRKYVEYLKDEARRHSLLSRRTITLSALIRDLILEHYPVEDAPND